jgi:hypothetical protein
MWRESKRMIKGIELRRKLPKVNMQQTNNTQVQNAYT